MKAHILIVEDEAILYDRLQTVLEKEHYTVDEFTPSVGEAIGRINKRRPDIILLDINLEGELSGLDLGRMLDKDYHIPFIYVTGFDDDETFFEGLSTRHERFIVKTKPRLKPKEIIRAIQTVLKRRAVDKPQFIKDGIMGLVMYLEEMKFTGKDEIVKVPIPFDAIAYFTVKPFVNQDDEEEDLKDNYLWFQTNKKGEYYFFRSSLSELAKTLPHCFVRINESYIVNLSPNMLMGKINGTKISILNETHTISERYKKEVKNRIKNLYKE